MEELRGIAPRSASLSD